MKPAIALAAAVLAVGHVPATAQSGGLAELSIQGYYLRTGSQLSAGTTGLGFKIDQFLPNTGLLRANFEAYRSGGFQLADNYLQLRRLIWRGLRWNFNGGDFRVSGTVLPAPFTNLFIPEIQARGVQVEAADSRREYSIFYGGETLMAGPRIPFRARIPQNVLGASVRQRNGRLETGARALLLTNSRTAEGGFIPAGRNFTTAGNLSVFSSFTFNDHFRWYGEATVARARSGDDIRPGGAFSYLFGPAWESPRLTVRVNYANLARTYLPLIGYWVGDRKGPFGEFQLRPFRRFQIFGSASRYETASRTEGKLPFLRSEAQSAGFYVDMPLKVNLSTQVSSSSFESSDPLRGDAQRSTNRQWSATLSRRIGPDTIRVSARDSRIVATALTGTERSVETEHMLQFGHFLVGGGVRAQQTSGTERRRSVYARGSAQLNLGRVSAFAFYEGGKDLADSTVFATNATNSTVVSASVRVTRRWSVQTEAFRSHLISEINPENLFVQASQNLALGSVLSRFNQWSFLFRIVRTFSWGAALPAAGLDQFVARRLPITGTVEGYVYLVTASGREPAPGVALNLETGQSAVTDGNGKYKLADVAEGPHSVAIDMERLPADYNPGPRVTAAVAASPRQTAHADFEVYSLGGFGGKVTARVGAGFESLEGILIRLEPGGQYTVTASNGSFAFYNLTEGTYRARIDPATLPARARLIGDAVIPVTIRAGRTGAAVEFLIDRETAAQRPVRQMFERVLDGPAGATWDPSAKLPQKY